MANSISHASLPFPVKGARFSVLVGLLDADGDPTAQTTPDTEVSLDAGAAADAAEEVTAISGMDGMGYITFSGAETNVSALAVNFKAASGPKASLMMIYPRVLPVEHSGTAQAGAAGTITLASGASAIDDYYNGCIIKTTGGTGGGGTGGANNQARVITDYVGSTKVATISPSWETNPSSDTTYEVLLTDMACNALRALRPTVDQRTANVSTTGVVDANLTKINGTQPAIIHWQAMGPAVVHLNDNTTRFFVRLTNSLGGALPTTAQITPGTYSVFVRRAHATGQGASTWAITSGVACSEVAGMIYADLAIIENPSFEHGDMAYVEFLGQKVTVDGVDFEVSGASGGIQLHFYVAHNTDIDTLADTGVNVWKISGDATAADNAEAFFDGTGYAGTNNVIPTVGSLATQAQTDVRSAMTAQGYTEARADKLDNLDVAVSSVASGGDPPVEIN